MFLRMSLFTIQIFSYLILTYSHKLVTIIMSLFCWQIYDYSYIFIKPSLFALHTSKNHTKYKLKRSKTHTGFVKKLYIIICRQTIFRSS